MENKKSTIKTILLTVALVLVAGILAISFAYFTINYEEGELFTTSGKAQNNEPEITFTENVEGISLDGTYPMPDSVGYEKSKDYTFTVTAVNNTQNVKVNVYIQTAETNTLDDNLVNVYYNGIVKTVGTQTTAKTVDTGFNKAYYLGYFVLGPNESDSKTLRMWVNENGTVENALDKIWSSKIYVVPEYTEDKATAKLVAGSLAEKLVKQSNASTVADYNSGVKTEMYTFTHPEAEQTTNLIEEERIDYRYIGNTPNNYITFNNETWRIIGVFTVENENGEKEQRIKIIRDASLGGMSWDMKSDETNINEWPTSTLSTMLNGDYINKGSSFDYTWYNNSGTAKTTTINGLNSTAQNQVSSVKWYLGGNSTYENLGGPDYYSFERGTKVYKERSTNVIAKVGLMYPSDYVYTYALGVDNTCYSNGYNCDTGTPRAGWLFNSSYQWTISPYSPIHNVVFYVSYSSSISSGNDNNFLAVRPTVYLRSDIEITEGDGSSGNPYILEE